ncbi:MAG TPA: two-component regulator propeller domain-containing protein [Longimicrobiales bacterium]
MRCFLLALCVALHASAAHAQHGFWQPDERVLITSFLHARSIATDQRHVFIATTTGLEIYDQTFRRWLAPSTIEDGYPALERPARIAYDAREGGIWLLTEAQTLYTYNQPLQRWQQRFPTDLPPDVRTSMLGGPGDRDPALQIMRNVAGRDGAGRTWQVTAIVPAERSGTYWAASYGGNFAFVDTRSLSSESFTFGTVSRGVSALTRDPDGNIWFGGDGDGPRNGVARADRALQRWQHFEAGVQEAPRGRVHAFSVSPFGLAVAALDGTYRFGENGWRRVTDTEARALAYTTDRLWIGGRGLLGWLDQAEQFHRADFPLQTVFALATRNDSLWIGGEAGLYRWVQGNVQQLANGSVLDIAMARDTVVVLTRSGVQTWNGAGMSLPLRTAALARVGRPTAIASEGDRANPGARVWIGGTDGLAEWNTADNTWRYLTIPGDIPEGPILDVLADGEFVWVATPAGALRLEWN